MSTDFPAVDAIQETKGADGCSAAPCADAFVTRVDASGSSLVYSTYLGGSQEDFGNGIRADGNGAVFVTGKTLSSGFPTTPGAYDLVLDTAYSDAFVVKISGAAPPPPPTGMSPTYNWHYAYDNLQRLTYACSDWDPGTSTCLGEAFNYSYDGAGNLLAFSRWDEAGAQVET
ncbi:MAG: SBBP repeat-containing protein, partial [Anaerolineales bacterium]